MKLSKFANLVKNGGRCAVLHVAGSGIWLSTGTAIYRATELPDMEGSEQVRTVLDMTADAWKKVYLTEDWPESVNDRCTKSHEYIFLLSKSERYYFDAAAISEPVTSAKGNARTFRGGGAYTGGRSHDNSAQVGRESHGNSKNKTGRRNKRSVWSVSTNGFRGAHFATFPEKLIEPCILAGCPEGGVVLDPFAGSGTAGVVAKRMGRGFMGCEINPSYVEMAARRIAEVE